MDEETKGQRSSSRVQCSSQPDPASLSLLILLKILMWWVIGDICANRQGVGLRGTRGLADDGQKPCGVLGWPGCLMGSRGYFCGVV